MELIDIVAWFGIPAAITGIGAWWIKRKVEANEKKQAERDTNIETLILVMMQTSRANSIGIEAIAKAVQRIPDAHCNGDMHEALAKMDELQRKEKDFCYCRQSHPSRSGGYLRRSSMADRLDQRLHHFQRF